MVSLLQGVIPKGLLDSLCTQILATRDGNITVSLDVEATTERNVGTER
jgi:hypothetical protein